jgi:hypothetical protein
MKEEGTTAIAKKPPASGRTEPEERTSTALVPTTKEALTAQLTQLFPPLPGSRRDEERAVRLVDLPPAMQQAMIVAHGLPADIEPAFVVFLQGIPYPTKDALLDLSAKRNVVAMRAEPLPPMKCVDLGCSTSRVTGWTAEGNKYDSYGDAFKALRKRYPTADEKFVKRKIWADRVSEPAAEWQRTLFSRAFVTVGKVELSFVGDACPHSCTDVGSRALSRMSQTRALNITLRAAVKLPGSSAEELPRIIIDHATGQVVGQKLADEDQQQDPPVTGEIDVDFTDEQMEDASRLAGLLDLNRGQLHQLIGEKGSAQATLDELNGRLSRRASKATGPDAGRKAPPLVKADLLAGIEKERLRLKMPDADWNSLVKGHLGTTLPETVADVNRLNEFLMKMRGVTLAGAR